MMLILENKEVKGFITNVYNTEDYSEEKERKEAKKKDSKCRSLIVQCLENIQLDLIRNKDTAYAMWSTLEDRYEKKGFLGQLMLR